MDYSSPAFKAVLAAHYKNRQNCIEGDYENIKKGK